MLGYNNATVAVAEGLGRPPIEVQEKAAGTAVGTSEKSRRPRAKKVSEVHDFIPTTDPHVRLRVAKGVDVEIAQDYLDLLLSIGRSFARRAFQIDALTAEQEDPEVKLKKIGQQTGVKGFVEDPTEEQDGIDLTIIPATSITDVNEELFRSGNIALFSRVTHPEWVIQVTVPDGYLGNRGAITAEIVHTAVLGLVTKLGMKQEDQESRVAKTRNLNLDKPALLEAFRAGEKIPAGVFATEIRWSIDAKPIPRPQQSVG